VVDSGDQGSAGKPVSIQGNIYSLRTVLDRASYGGPLTIMAINGNYVQLRDMVFLGGSLEAPVGNTVLRNLVFTNGSLTLGGANPVAQDIQLDGGGVSVAASPATLSRIAVKNNGFTLLGTNIVLENSFVFGGAGPAVNFTGGSLLMRNNTLLSGGTQYRQAGSGNATLENNILVAGGTDRFCIFWEGGSLASDYNDLVATNGAWIGNRNGNWERLLYWQRESGLDPHSVSAEPMFVNEAAGDLHLKSVSGHYTPTGWVSDGVHSPCIDAGNPSSVATNELPPNGGRVNLGAYGGTAQASLSRSNSTPWLQAVTVNDSGVLKGTATLRWLSGNLGISDLVQIDYSTDSGTNWVTVLSGIPATDGQCLWNTTTATSSLFALWRVALQTNAAVNDPVDRILAVRNGPLPFYVNDTSRSNDVYCSAAGTPGGSGLSPASPKLTIQAILSAYDTEGGDTIYVDSGTNNLASEITVIWSRGGDNGASSNLVIQGSTNMASGGSILARNSLFGGNNAINVRASHVTLRDLTVQQSYQGITFESNRFSVAERLLVRSNMLGIVNINTLNITNRNIRFWNNRLGALAINNARTTVVENCSFSGNSNYAISVQSSVNNTFQNNIFHVGASNTPALSGESNLIRSAFIDYNAYFLEAPSTTLWGTYADLKTWQLNEQHDFRSAITNPLFADAEGGDFHLRSQAGRWLDGYGWTTDVEHSWAIDKGNPATAFSLEPQTNGDRVNIGAYGNTEFASKSSTNALVFCRVLNDPQFIGETNSIWPLIWTAINVPPSETFTVQYSGDGGASWITLAGGVPAYTEYIIWPTLPYYNTYQGRWRVIGETNPRYTDTNDAPFTIFYGQFAISEVARDIYNRVRWRGAWDETYQVQFATNLVKTNGMVWANALDGTGLNQRANFVSTNGGDFLYEDISSTNVGKFRTYRILWEQY
jgi:parallel beta-helix repeat protein